MACLAGWVVKEVGFMHFAPCLRNHIYHIDLNYPYYSNHSGPLYHLDRSMWYRWFIKHGAKCIKSTGQLELVKIRSVLTCHGDNGQIVKVGQSQRTWFQCCTLPFAVLPCSMGPCIAFINIVIVFLHTFWKVVETLCGTCLTHKNSWAEGHKSRSQPGKVDSSADCYFWINHWICDPFLSRRRGTG